MSCKNNSKIFSVFLCVVFSYLASSENFSISNDGKVDESVALNSNLDKNLSNPVTIGDLTFGANEVLSEGNEIFEAKDGDPLRHLNIRISGLDGVGVRSVKVMSPSLIDIEIGKIANSSVGVVSSSTLNKFNCSTDKPEIKTESNKTPMHYGMRGSLL